MRAAALTARETMRVVMDAVRCPSCGEENPARARFCLNCGTPLTADAAAPGREVRKTLTVLFADMVGFTALGDRLDQESLRRVMDRFYGEMRGAIEGQGGTVAKFIGDAVMAVWGTPTVNEDDALRAVRAAEDMRQALAVLNKDLEQRWGVNVGVRTGVNTGEVVVDPTKSADLLVGDTLNVAARLEQAAAPGEILVGAETFRLVRDDARLEPVEPLELKGKGRPVPAFRLIDGSASAERQRDHLTAPLVGRARELARLHAALEAATGAAETRVVTLIGSPGVGKSRLVADFAGSLGESATVVTGHCEAAGEGLTFLPIAEVVRSGAGIHEGDSAQSAHYKLEAVLPEDDPVRDHVVDRALGLVGLGPPVSVEESFWAVRRFLEGLARLRRLVVLLDDVHWGQPTFLDLIEHLAAWGREAPILVVLLARPEIRALRPTLTERNEAVSEVIALGPLQPGDSRDLITRLLGEAEVPPELYDRVLETTEGNPLFLGEMLRMLVDDGVLRRENGRWVTDERGALVVPPTVHALLAARIERLSAGERAVVERAAVIGQQFYVGAVAELSPPEVSGHVDEHLDLLRRKELVVPEGTLWEGEEVFRFHHVLIRDAAYRSLLKEARADLHERFAAWLGDRAGEHEELIALHLERAHAYREQLGPLDEHGAALAARAAERLHFAGRRALEREDLPAAANLLTRALHPLDVENPMRLQVLADLAETQLSAGDTAAAEETVEELALRAEEVDDGPMRALATAFACQLAILTGAGHVHETIELASEAADVLAAAGLRAAEAKAHHVAAQAHTLLGEIALAETALDRALVAAREARDRRRVTAVLSGAPRAALWGPSPIVRASGRCLDVVRILRMTPGNRHVEASALRCQAVLEAMRGRSDAAREILASCRETLEELGMTLELDETETYAGLVELLAGDAVAAERHLREAREGFASLRVDSGAAQASALLARALIEQGRFHDAEEETRLARRYGGEDLKTGIAWRGARAQVLARRGEHEEAEALAREAVALAEPTDALADKAEALMALAAVLRAGGKEADFREAATRAHALYVAKDHTVGAMRARATLGGRPAEAGAVGGADLGDRAVERVWGEFSRAFNARDWEAARALITDDIVLVDHRAVGWEEVIGADAFLDYQRSGSAIAPSATMQVESVLDAEDDLASVVCAVHARAHEGGSALEVRLGILARLREGRVERVELFPPGEQDAMRERMAELRDGETGAFRDIWEEYAELVAARDWEGLRRLYAEDHVLIDHRRVGWGHMEGVEAVIEAHRTAVEVAPDLAARLEAVLLADETAGVMAGRLALRGTTATGGDAETMVVALAVVQDGRVARNEFFDLEDEAGWRGRYEQLRKASVPRRPVPSAVRERFERWARIAGEERYDEIDPSPDYVYVDRRRHGSEGMSGPEAEIGLLRTVHGAAKNVRFTPDLLAGLSDGTTDIGAARFLLTGEARAGGGPFEVGYLNVTMYRDGRTVQSEVFDPGDEDGLMRRFDELCEEHFAGVTLSPLARGPIDPPAVASVVAWARAFNAADVEAVAATWAEDVVRVDRRPIGSDDIRGRAALADDLRTMWATAPGLSTTVQVLGAAADGDRHVTATLNTFTGTGPWGTDAVVGVGTLVVGHAGIAEWLELVPDDDPEAVLTRFSELLHPLGVEWLAALNSRDSARIRALLADSFTLLDHRPLGWDTLRGPDIMVDRTQTVTATSEDTLWEADLLGVEQRGDRIVEMERVMISGTVDGARWELPFLSLGVIEDGLRTGIELFELEDEDRMLAAFDALIGAEIVAARKRWVAAFNARDWDTMRAGYAPDVVRVDTRPLAWEEMQGPEAAIAQFMAVVEQAPDLRADAELVDARGDLASGVAGELFRWSGTGDGGAVFEVTMGLVSVYRDGLVARLEVLDDDRAAVAARCAELAAPAAGAAAGPS